MKTEKTNKRCTTVREWLYKALISHVGLDSDWVVNHVANCPRCQRRLASVSKVNLALTIIKTQPHKLDLLMRANAQAVGVLKHSLRNCSKAEKLKVMVPEPKMLEKCGKYKGSVANAAACIAILFLMKAGIFSSMSEFESQGQKAIKHYYAAQVGDDLADEIFTS